MFADERVGNLVVISSDSSQIKAIKSQTALIVRKTSSNPTRNGARIVADVLNNPALNTEWYELFIGDVENSPTMHCLAGILRDTQSKSFTLSVIEFVWVSNSKIMHCWICFTCPVVGSRYKC